MKTEGPSEKDMHYTITENKEISTWWTVSGPGLEKPRNYPTEDVAKTAATLFEGIYLAGRKEGSNADWPTMCPNNVCENH
jgi:hypothetical protein